MYLLNWLRNKLSKSVMVGPDGAELGRFIKEIDKMVKTNCSISHIEKINSFLDIALFESPLWLLKEAFDWELAHNILDFRGTIGLKRVSWIKLGYFIYFRASPTNLSYSTLIWTIKITDWCSDEQFHLGENQIFMKFLIVTRVFLCLP